MKRGAWWPIGITTVLATTVAANIWVMPASSLTVVLASWLSTTFPREGER